MHIVAVLAPVFLLIALGAGLAAIHFLGRNFIGELNKLAFWVALPALIFRAAAHAGHPPPITLWLIGVITAATLAVLAGSALLSRLTGLPAESRPTFVATAFFGNLAYIGIPILAHSLGHVALGDAPELLATAVLVMTAMTVINNALAATTFQGRDLKPGPFVRRVLLNPLVIAGTLGLLYGLTGAAIPPALDEVLRSLGGLAVPLSLLCIGGALEMTPLTRRFGAIAFATTLKVAALPAVGWLLCRLLDLGPADTRVALVFCACPTAVVAYTMATQMRGDAPFAAGTIAVTTAASVVSLAVVLAIT